MQRMRGFTCTIHSAIFLLLIVICPGAVWGQSASLTLLTVNDVYEITPVQGKGGLAELMTLLRAERATATPARPSRHSARPCLSPSSRRSARLSS